MSFAAAMHLKVQPGLTKAGVRRSATAIIAYRFGARLIAPDGAVHDYRRKLDIVATTILADHDWARDPQALASAIGKANSRKDAQLGRELRLDMSRLIPESERIALVTRFVADQMRRDGIAYTIALHDPPALDGGRNPHAHIYWDDRPTLNDGRLGPKIRKTKQEHAADLTRWRETWAEAQNRVLARHGIADRLDHRSYKEQGIDKMPEPKLGVAGHRVLRSFATGKPVPTRYRRKIERIAGRRMDAEAARLGKKYMIEPRGSNQRIDDLVPLPVATSRERIERLIADRASNKADSAERIRELMSRRAYVTRSAGQLVRGISAQAERVVGELTRED